MEEGRQASALTSNLILLCVELQDCVKRYRLGRGLDFEQRVNSETHAALLFTGGFQTHPHPFEARLETLLTQIGNARVRDHYRRSMRAARERQIRLFNKFGLDHCVVRTDRPNIRPLRDLFARRAKRVHR